MRVSVVLVALMPWKCRRYKNNRKEISERPRTCNFSLSLLALNIVEHSEKPINL